MNKEELDVSKIFLAYLVANGDPIRTAQIAQCKVEEVDFLSRSELWDRKLADRGIAAGGSPEDARERTKELNRATNYVQAIRLRALIDKTIKWIYENDENILKFNTETNKQGGKVFSTKPLLDLVKAGEVAQQMIYRSLGDVVEKGAGGLSAAAGLKELHRYVTDAMSHLPAGALPELKSVEKTDPAAEAIGYLDADAVLNDK